MAVHPANLAACIQLRRVKVVLMMLVGPARLKRKQASDPCASWYRDAWIIRAEGRPDEQQAGTPAEGRQTKKGTLCEAAGGTAALREAGAEAAALQGWPALQGCTKGAVREQKRCQPLKVAVRE